VSGGGIKGEHANVRKIKNDRKKKKKEVKAVDPAEGLLRVAKEKPGRME